MRRTSQSSWSSIITVHRYKKFMDAAEAEAFVGHSVVAAPMDVHNSPEKVVPETTSATNFVPKTASATNRASPYGKAETSTISKAEPTSPIAARILVEKPETVNSTSINASSSSVKWFQRDTSPDIQDESDWDVAYSDGACKGNGKPGSIAGIGVWWQTDDPR